MAKKRLTKTDRKITRLVAAAEQQLDDRRERLDHVLRDHIEELTNDDLETIENILTPIIGRLVLERETHRIARDREESDGVEEDQ